MNGFSLLVGIAASLALWEIASRDPESQALARVKAGLAVLALSLVGARISYVLYFPRYFNNDLLRMLRFWDGGVAWPGALIGALLGLLLAALVWRKPFGMVADAVLPLFPIVSAAAWMGCWQAGCFYGIEMPFPDGWGINVQDPTGAIAHRMPLQPAAAALVLILFYWLGSISLPAETSGLRAGVGFFLLGSVLRLFSNWRADPLPLWQGLHTEQLVSTGLIALGGLIALASWLTYLRKIRREVRRAKKAKSSNPSSSVSPF